MPAVESRAFLPAEWTIWSSRSRRANEPRGELHGSRADTRLDRGGLSRGVKWRKAETARQKERRIARDEGERNAGRVEIEDTLNAEEEDQSGEGKGRNES